MLNKKITITALAVIIFGSNFLPLISFMAPRMVKYTISGINVYAVPEDLHNAQKIIDDIVEEKERIVSALPGTNSNNIDVVIYPNHKSLHLNTFGFAGYFFPSWYVGKNTRDRVLITSPSNPGPSHSRESIEKAAIHEYVHVLTDRINKDIGYWMKEGLALYLAKQVPKDNDVISYSQNITFKDFDTHNPFKFANYGGYSMAHSYIKYLEEKYGWEKVIQMLNIDSNVDMVSGVTEKEVFTNWKKWVLENYS